MVFGRMGEWELADEPYYHTSRVAAAIEKAVLTEELRTISMARRDLCTLIQRKKDYKKRRGRSPAANDLSDNDKA